MIRGRSVARPLSFELIQLPVRKPRSGWRLETADDEILQFHRLLGCLDLGLYGILASEIRDDLDLVFLAIVLGAILDFGMFGGTIERHGEPRGALIVSEAIFHHVISGDKQAVGRDEKT